LRNQKSEYRSNSSTFVLICGNTLHIAQKSGSAIACPWVEAFSSMFAYLTFKSQFLSTAHEWGSAYRNHKPPRSLTT